MHSLTWRHISHFWFHLELQTCVTRDHTSAGGSLERHVCEWGDSCVQRGVKRLISRVSQCFPRQVTHPLSEQLLSLRLRFPQFPLDLHQIQQRRAVR